eukprot:11171336-Lingulodinium_polyedra.AAC.1
MAHIPGPQGILQRGQGFWPRWAGDLPLCLRQGDCFGHGTEGAAASCVPVQAAGGLSSRPG